MGCFCGDPMVYNFTMRKYDFLGRWSVITNNMRQSKKTEGEKAQKSGVVGLLPSKRHCLPLPLHQERGVVIGVGREGRVGECLW